jgi:3-phenylpropionate/cinnamic acid dioxygenase small subunit
MTAETALRQLADRTAIRDVILRYARGVDRRDWALVASCFATDAFADYDDVVKGTATEMIAVIAPALARFANTMHVMGNQLIELAGDTAESETYAVCYHRLGENRVMVVGLRYLDRLQRDRERWLIQRRVVKFEWLQRP